MRDVLESVAGWFELGADVGLATVINTWGSAPRGVGAKMAFTREGQIAGSVSGGCVEGAVYDTGLEILGGGSPRLLHFGVDDETAWDVGLACGGQIDVFVERLNPFFFNRISEAYGLDVEFAAGTIISGEPAFLGKRTIIQSDGHILGEVNQAVDEQIRYLARSQMEAGKSALKQIDQGAAVADPAEIFIEVVRPSPTLIIVGGVHIAVALSAFAKNLGYKTIVIDPRRSFGSPERFAHVDRLVQLWPELAFQEITLTPTTAVAILTHDPKIDDPAIISAVSSPVFYIGALGSRKTHAARLKRLTDAGVSEEQLARVLGPIGLDIGAKTPEEIAISIMAQIIESRST